MLADYACVTPDGKITTVGGGWQYTGPDPVPFAVALLIDVPWNETNKKHKVRMDLIDSDGNGVTPLGDNEPKWIEMEFKVGRQPGSRPGALMDPRAS